MTDRSGLGVVEVAILEALSRLGAGAGRRYIKTETVLAELSRAIGLGPGYSYPILCDMARPWVVNLCCVDFHGNFGGPGPGDDAATPQYTETRLSPIGVLALTAERGEGGAVPIGLVNGDLYCWVAFSPSRFRGVRLPFDPDRMIDGLLRVVEEPSIGDDELIELVGPPSFPTRCLVGGDIASVMVGEQGDLELTPRLREAPPPERGWLIDRFPPFKSSVEVAQDLASRARFDERYWSAERPALHRATRLPVAQVEDLSSRDEALLKVTAEPDADLTELGEQLRGLASWTFSELRMPAPLASLLRTWVAANASCDLRGSFTDLRRLHRERPIDGAP